MSNKPILIKNTINKKLKQSFYAIISWVSSSSLDDSSFSLSSSTLFSCTLLKLLGVKEILINGNYFLTLNMIE